MKNRSAAVVAVVLATSFASMARATEPETAGPDPFLFVRAVTRTVDGTEATGVEVRSGVRFQTLFVHPKAPGAKALRDTIETLKPDQSIVIRRSTEGKSAWLADIQRASQNEELFYVDPDTRVGDRDGSAARPWTSMSDRGAWKAVDAALATRDVTVYFSARKADQDADEPYDACLQPMRTDKSNHRLTLDGMSKYSTSSTKPVWADNRGKSRCVLYTPSSGNCIHWATLQDYLTIKGFRGRGMAHLYGGSHFIFRDNVIVGFTTYQYARYHRQHLVNGGCTDLAFIGNDLCNPNGEGLYIGGAGNTGKSGHDSILVERNTLHDCGEAGGEGDGLDMKDNNTRVVVRYNVFRDNHHSGCSSHSGGQWYANVVYNNPVGMFFTTYWGRIDGLLIGNNLVYANTTKGIKVNCDKGDLVDVRVYNNTVVANAKSGLELSGSASHTARAILRNNIATGSALAVYKGGVWASLSSDHNDWHGEVAGVARSATDIRADPKFAGAAPYTAESFRLQPGSPCIGAGVELTECQDDITGLRRPEGKPWDMGAYGYSPAAGPTVR